MSPQMEEKGPEPFSPYLRFDGASQRKFSARSMLPVPTYFATCGSGHSGRVRTIFPPSDRDTINLSGAVPFSTHCSMAAMASNVLGQTLVPVLKNWTHTQAGFYLYVPTREHMPPKVRALMDFLIEKRDEIKLP